MLRNQRKIAMAAGQLKGIVRPRLSAPAIQSAAFSFVNQVRVQCRTSSGVTTGTPYSR